ncbi:MAG: CAP domain-containing protein [Actinomycetes bacterium]
MRPRVMLMSALTALCLGATALAGAPAAQAGTTTAEARFVARINKARANHGLAPLRVRSDLTRYARRHSASMSRLGTLYHTSNFSIVCCWSSISENVGHGGGVRRVHRAFMASPSHRANILDPRKRALGVGVVFTGGRLWVTEVFRQPR